MPAAASRWPRLVFTDPMSSGGSRAVAAQGFAEGVGFDRVADGGAGAVRFDELDRAASMPASRRRRGRARLGLRTGDGDAVGAAVLVHRRAEDHGVNRVAVGDGLREALEQRRCPRLRRGRSRWPRRRTPCTCRPAKASPPGEKPMKPPGVIMTVTPPAMATLQRPVQDVLAGHVDGGERGGAGRVHGDARAL